MNDKELKQLIKQEGDRKDGNYRGYQYVIMRIKGSGTSDRIHLNGYVAIPESHPLYNIDYSESFCGHHGCFEHTPDSVIHVHGGLTFSGIVEFPDGEKKAYGFDTAHAGDRAFMKPTFEGKETYRDMNYVESECKKMIDQLIAYGDDHE